MRPIAAWCVAIALLAPTAVHAQQRTEYRAFWVDTFNTLLSNHANVVAAVNNAKNAKANAIFAQVRRRGDSWYLNSLEPLPNLGTPIVPPFDPLADLLTTAHAEGIEVHAFVIVGAIWSSAPAAPAIVLHPSPNHVFNQHGGWNPATSSIVPGPNNWLTRTHPSVTGGTAGTTFDGHKVGNDFWIDLGHPAAAQYSYDVLMKLVRSYPTLDGLHLDRIRYPELSGNGTQTPSGGTNTGYNQTSVDRFNLRHSQSGLPARNNALWNQWRRDQVSNFVRRIYVNVVNEQPHMKISASLIAFGGAPTTDWNTAEAYWRVYQDWRSWTEEGILDLPMPMVYKGEHVLTPTPLAPQFDSWLAWMRTHQYDRMGLIGIGAANNAIEGTLRQARRTLTPAVAPERNVGGVSLYSMATSNIATTPATNIFAIPPSVTLVRSFAEFASGLKTGKSVNGLTLYEDPVANPTGIFADAATIPVLSWKAAPTKGHVMGFATRADSTILDTAGVVVTNAITGATKLSQSDGNGFYGAVDLTPNLHSARANLGAESRFSCFFNVLAGKVTSIDIDATTAPQVSRPPAAFNVNADPGMCSATVNTGTFTITDGCSLGRAISSSRSDGGNAGDPFPIGVTTITWSITDAYGTTSYVQTVTVKDTQAPAIVPPVTINAATDPGSCSATVVVALPNASDNCGYTLTHERSDGAGLDAPYPKGITTIVWTATDAGGLKGTATQLVVVTDNEPPQIAAPADIEVATAPGSCSAAANAGSATASDNCVTVNVTAVRSDGQPLSALYPKGLTTITWTATDGAGLTSTDIQNIQVNDTEAPEINRLRTNRDRLWPPIHQMVPVMVSYDTDDNCGGVTTSIAVTSNEDVNGLGDGDTSPDWEVVSSHEVLLRAERSALGSGRVYTITVTATDASGNTKTASTTVSVPFSMGNN